MHNTAGNTGRSKSTYMEHVDVAVVRSRQRLLLVAALLWQLQVGWYAVCLRDAWREILAQ